MIPTHDSTSFGLRRLRSVVSLGALLLACTSVSSAFAAAVIFDSVGFEQPKFSTTFAGGNYAGQLEGQAIFPEPFPIGTWKQTKPIGVFTSKAKVVDGTTITPASGLQSVEVTRAADTDARWSVTDTGWPSQRYICIDWDMLVLPTSLPPDSFGPYFAVEAYDDDDPAVPGLTLLASLGVDASNGEMLYQAEGTGFLTAPGPVVPFGQWNHFTILLDYATHEFDIYLNGIFVPTPLDRFGQPTDGFVDHTLLNPLDEFTDAPIAALAAGGDTDSQQAAGTAYYDNYKVIQSATNPCMPEPATWALGMLGLSALAARGRSRRSGC